MDIQEAINMKYLIFALAVFFTISANGQSFDYSIKVSPEVSPTNEFDTLYVHALVIDVSDTTNTSTIHIISGTSQGQNDLIDETIQFDQTTFLPSGISYYRRNKKIHLGLGKYDIQQAYYNLRITDTLGNFSPPILKNTNNQ